MDIERSASPRPDSEPSLSSEELPPPPPPSSSDED
eukprot:CAMPEP_0118638290 /NCGR_PEP_ID=MMETSP0785-20121206/3599_1 /TAXON_ID=91992 /ORGANISM="Bolidomonas pacifica, Strain CCMP 1866" /LENGTH=34 /DNA_ID= /DNA_START= /DNA_END= /DNA_ORIENTATION=